MRVALIGTRGVPARYGGFETCVEELGRRLVKRGHEVHVYGRSSYYLQKQKEYLGMKLHYLPELNIKFLETLSHTFLSLLDSLFRPYDLLLVFNNANSPLLLIPKLGGKRVVLHTDGLEWKRGKWSALGQRYYRFTEWLASRLTVELVSDSQEIQKYYRKKYRRDSHYLSYGASLQFSQDDSALRKYGLLSREYFLQVTRFEPENNPLLAIRAFEGLRTEKKLVLVGGVRYPTKYSEEVYAAKDRRIKFLGFIYDRYLLRELLCNCYAYLHGNEVGGTNPALLEAMASGCFVVCRDVVFNREVLQDAGVYFEKTVGDLREKLEWALSNPEILKTNGEQAREIIRRNYDWDEVISGYERLFQGLAAGARVYW